LQNLSWKVWLIVLAAFLLTMLLEELSRSLNDIVASTFPPGAHLPNFLRPGYEVTFPPTEFVGLSLQGRYWMIPYMLVCLFFNIVGEGFMWRGFLLPRMEITFGRWAWFVNGLLWGFVFHCAFPHLYVGLLPGSLIAPFLAQKFKSSLASMTIHGIGNLMLLVFIVPGL
jgi:membrane protease YdiL (CAAX protease family)